MEIVFILANSIDPDEMPLHAAFHLGLHCLPNCTLRMVESQTDDWPDIKALLQKDQFL